MSTENLDDWVVVDSPNNLYARDRDFETAKSTLKEYRDGETYNSFSRRIESWAKKAETDIAETASQAFVVSSTSTNPGIMAQIKQEAAAIKKDAKLLFRLHVGSVVNSAKREMQSGTKVGKLAKALSFTGELWDGLSGFWNDLVDKHYVLKPLDRLVIKPCAISLYAAALPEIAVVKACELIGRSISGIAKTGKVFQSIINAAKKTSISIIKHALRLSSGTSLNPAVASFLNTFGLSEDRQKDLLDIIVSPEQIKMLKKLTPDVAKALAENLGEWTKDSGVSFSEIVTPMLECLTNASKDPITLDMKGFDEYLTQKNPDLRAKLSGANLFPGDRPLGLNDVISNIHKMKNLKSDVKKELLKFAKAYGAQQMVGCAKDYVLALLPPVSQPLDLEHTKVKGSFSAKYPSRRASAATHLEMAKIAARNSPTKDMRKSTIF